MTTPAASPAFVPCTMFAIRYDGGVGTPVPVRVISRGLAAEGCSVETYLYRDESGRRVRCSLSLLHASEKEAYAVLVGYAEGQAKEAEESVVRAQKHLAEMTAGLATLKAKLAACI